jgi:hypothetical protein
MPPTLLQKLLAVALSNAATERETLAKESAATLAACKAEYEAKLAAQEAAAAATIGRLTAEAMAEKDMLDHALRVRNMCKVLS